MCLRLTRAPLQWNYGQAQQWQQGDYEGQAPGAEEPAVPGQEAEVPPVRARSLTTRSSPCCRV